VVLSRAATFVSSLPFPLDLPSHSPQTPWTKPVWYWGKTTFYLLRNEEVTVIWPNMAESLIPHFIIVRVVDLQGKRRTEISSTSHHAKRKPSSNFCCICLTLDSL
jgi:hypothetical protein